MSSFLGARDFGFLPSGCGGGGGGGITSVCTCNTPTFSFYGDGTCFNPLCGCPIISSCAGNSLVACSDGLFSSGGGGGNAVIVLGAGTCSNYRCCVNNLSSGSYSSAFGGYCNQATNNDTIVVGGFCNISSGCISTTVNGAKNITSGYGGFTGSGYNNITSGLAWAFTGSGFYNVTSGGTSFTGNGEFNTSSGDFSSIISGKSNTASGYHSFIGTGFLNTTSCCFSFIGTGRCNSATRNHSIVVGGMCNLTCSDFSIIGGGQNNTISSIYGSNNSISAGQKNTIYTSSTNSAILAGCTNAICCRNSTILNGIGNISTQCNSTIAGGNMNVVGDSCCWNYFDIICASANILYFCQSTANNFWSIGNTVNYYDCTTKSLYYLQITAQCYDNIANVSCITFNCSVGSSCCGIARNLNKLRCRGFNSFIDGGFNNTTESNYTFVSSGNSNRIINQCSKYNYIHNGCYNCITCSPVSHIGNGSANVICSCYSNIDNGTFNNISNITTSNKVYRVDSSNSCCIVAVGNITSSIVSGDSITALLQNFTTGEQVVKVDVANSSFNGFNTIICTTSANLPTSTGGYLRKNTNSGNYGFFNSILNGQINEIKALYSVILSGQCNCIYT